MKILLVGSPKIQPWSKTNISDCKGNTEGSKRSHRLKEREKYRIICHLSEVGNDDGTPVQGENHRISLYMKLLQNIPFQGGSQCHLTGGLG